MTSTILGQHIDCHVLVIIPLIDRSHHYESKGGIIENWVGFGRVDPFFALQMVNFSSLHEEGRDAESFHHYRHDSLVNALQNGCSIVILDYLFCIGVAVFRPIL
jgi:hypothetical protein